MTMLWAYEDKTREHRKEEGLTPCSSQQSVCTRPGFKRGGGGGGWSASSSMIVRWLKSVLEKASIYTSIFKAHCVLGAATRQPTMLGSQHVTSSMQLTGAPNQCSRDFIIYKSSRQTWFGHAILNPAGVDNTTYTH